MGKINEIKVNTMSGKYSITIENKSANTFDFGVFQTGENTNLSGAVIWLCKRCHPNTCVSFSWDTEYCFFWAEKGKMKQRKSSEYSAWGKEPADPSNQDKCIIGFTYTDGAYEFEQTSQKGTPGVLQIVQDGMIPAGKAVIGIGMSGNCIKCIRTQPNTTAEFELPVEYRVTFGSMNMGDPVNNVLMQQSVPLKFPPNVFGLTLTLNEDNTWSDPVSLCQHNAV